MPITSSNPVTLDGSYDFVEFVDGKMAPVPPLTGTRLTAKFEGGKLSGSGGVNAYTASYETSKDMPPSRVSISKVASTMVGGPQDVMDQERRFFEGLAAAGGVTYGDGTVALTWDNAQKSLVFRRL